MLALVAALIVLLELALGIALIGFILMGLAFTGEAYRNGLTPVHQAFVGIALVMAVLPAIVTLVVAWKRFASATRPEGIPLWIGLPLLVLVLCAGLSVLALQQGEKSAARTWQAAREADRRALRAKVDGGARELSCDLVLEDFAATPDDMARCRARIESLADPVERWSEMKKFTDDWRGFHSWNPAQLGFTTEWDWNRTLIAVRHDQEWFLPAFYETWLARPDALQTKEDRAQLLACIEASGSWRGWKPAVSDAFVTTILPALQERLAAESIRFPPGDDEKQTLEHALEKSRARFKDARAPAPPPIPLPPGAIGLARFDADDTLHLWFRRTATEGEVGDVYLSYSGSWDGPYEPMLKHLKKPARGEVVPIPPIPAPR